MLIFEDDNAALAYKNIDTSTQYTDMSNKEKQQKDKADQQAKANEIANIKFFKGSQDNSIYGYTVSYKYANKNTILLIIGRIPNKEEIHNLKLKDFNPNDKKSIYNYSEDYSEFCIDKTTGRPTSLYKNHTEEYSTCSWEHIEAPNFPMKPEVSNKEAAEFIAKLLKHYILDKNSDLCKPEYYLNTKDGNVQFVNTNRNRFNRIIQTITDKHCNIMYGTKEEIDKRLNDLIKKYGIEKTASQVYYEYVKSEFGDEPASFIAKAIRNQGLAKTAKAFLYFIKIKYASKNGKFWFDYLFKVAKKKGVKKAKEQFAHLQQANKDYGKQLYEALYTLYEKYEDEKDIKERFKFLCDEYEKTRDMEKTMKAYKEKYDK